MCLLAQYKGSGYSDCFGSKDMLHMEFSLDGTSTRVIICKSGNVVKQHNRIVPGSEVFMT